MIVPICSFGDGIVVILVITGAVGSIAAGIVITLPVTLGNPSPNALWALIFIVLEPTL